MNDYIKYIVWRKWQYMGKSWGGCGLKIKMVMMMTLVLVIAMVLVSFESSSRAYHKCLLCRDTCRRVTGRKEMAECRRKCQRCMAQVRIRFCLHYFLQIRTMVLSVSNLKKPRVNKRSHKRVSQSMARLDIKLCFFKRKIMKNHEWN